MTITHELTQAAADAFESLGLSRRFGTVEPSRRPDLAHYQCNGAMAAAKEARRNPREIANEVAAKLSEREDLAEVSVAGPGFLNIKLSDEALAARAATLLDDERLGCPIAETPQRVVIDFGGPNVAKAMHVGHLRTSVIGDSLQRLFRFVGDDVTSDIHMGDWGLPMGLLITELAERQPELPYFDASNEGPYPEEPPVTAADLEELYPLAAGKAKEDPARREAARRATAELQAGRPGYRALWEHFMAVSLEALRADFGALGVDFDLWLGEAAVDHRLAGLIARLEKDGVLEESDGARVVRVEEEGDTKEMPPLIAVKADGGVTYGTTDLATIEDRVEKLDPAVFLYVVDKRQHLHFEQVFRAARKSGTVGEGASLEHIAFGTVNGTDGRPFKTREGGVMRLGVLIDRAIELSGERLDEGGLAQGASPEERAEIARKVGIAALKFADLANDRESNYVFNLDKFTRFEGKTGPYLLYAAVRVKSVFRKAAERGAEIGTPMAPLADAERNLVLKQLALPDAIARAHAERRPHMLCDFLYELAQEFSRFYNECPILKEEDVARRGSRLALAAITLRQVELVLELLGIEAPEQM